MKKKIVELPIEMPLVTEGDLFHNEMVWFLLVIASQILSVKRRKTDEELRIIKVYTLHSLVESMHTSDTVGHLNDCTHFGYFERSRISAYLFFDNRTNLFRSQIHRSVRTFLY